MSHFACTHWQEEIICHSLGFRGFLSVQSSQWLRAAGVVGGAIPSLARNLKRSMGKYKSIFITPSS